MGDEGGGSLISPDGVVPSWIVSVSASDISPCKIKSRRFLLAPAHRGSHEERAVGWLVGWILTALLTPTRSYRTCKFIHIFQKMKL